MAKQEKKQALANYWSMGAAIGLGAAVGVLQGALLGDLPLWLCLGAG